MSAAEQECGVTVTSFNSGQPCGSVHHGRSHPHQKECELRHPFFSFLTTIKRFSGRSSYGLYPESESESDESQDEGSSEYDSESGGDTYLRLSDLKMTRPEKSVKPSATPHS